MQSQLPKASEEHAETLYLMRDKILENHQDQIAFIILFGSFARGNWVYDYYREKLPDGSSGAYLEYASDKGASGLIIDLAHPVLNRIGYPRRYKLARAVRLVGMPSQIPLRYIPIRQRVSDSTLRLGIYLEYELARACGTSRVEFKASLPGSTRPRVPLSMARSV